jgi:hypothetical protein
MPAGGPLLSQLRIAIFTGATYPWPLSRELNGAILTLVHI